MSIKNEEDGCSANEIDYQNVTLFKNEYEEEYKVAREIKDEPMEDFFLSQRTNGSPVNFNIDDFGIYELMEKENASVKVEGEERGMIEFLAEEDLLATPIRSSDQSKGDEMAVDPFDATRIQTIRDGIITVTKTSKFKGETMDKLQAALYAFCIGELSVNAASKTFNLSQSTVNVYANKIRQLLGNTLHPQCVRESQPLNQPIEPRKHLDHIDSERIQIIGNVITTITRRSLFKGEAMDRLKAALFAICIEDLSVNAAAMKFNVNQKSLNDYANKMRQQLGSTLTPQYKHDDSLIKCDVNQFGSCESMVQEESRVEMEEIEPRSIVSTKDKGSTERPLRLLGNILHRQRKSQPLIVSQSIEPREHLDHVDSERIQTIGNVITAITHWSLMKGEAMDRLKTALFAICIEDLSVNAAAMKFNVNQKSLNDYANRMRQQLGSTLTPQYTQDDSPIKCDVNQFGNCESMVQEDSRVEMEEIEPRSIESTREEETATINQAIEMAIKSCKEVGAQADVMREALEDSMLRHIPLNEIVDDYGFTDQSSISYLINTTHAFLKEIRGEALRDLSPALVKLSSNRNYVVPGDSLDPHDSQRIRTIRDGIRDVIVRWRFRQNEDREKLLAAIYDVCIGQLTVNAASRKYNLSLNTLSTNVQKARLKLDSILPPQAASFNRPRMREGMKCATVTIYGIIVPRSIQLLNGMLLTGRLDYSNAQPFLGTKDELREKLITIFQSFNFNGKVETRVDAIMHYLNGQTLREACQSSKLDLCALSKYVKITKIFIDLANSPCTRDFQRRTVRKSTSSVAMDSGSFEPPQLLPIPPERMTNKDWGLQEEAEDEMIKEEPIESP